MSNPFVHQGDQVPWWWPWAVLPEQSREHTTFQDATSDVRDWFSPQPSLPVLMGTAAVAVPYVVGAGIILLAPPPWKPIGVSMVIPSPMDAAYFAAGYEFGENLEDWI